MHQRSSISFCKFLSRNAFQASRTPPSPSAFKNLTTISNQCISESIAPPNSKKLHSFLHRTSSNPPTQPRVFQNLRQYNVDTNKSVDEINLRFAEAREEIEMALESKETVYFDEEAECARTAVKEVMGMYEGLLAKQPESERGTIQRSMGLKIEQLKAEVEQLND